MILDLEYALGRKIRPPSAEDLRQSDVLTAQARDILRTNNRELFAQVVELLNRAIILNPANEAAKALKDSVTAQVGGTRQADLEPKVKTRWDEAQRLFREGSYLAALTIVNDLLNIPRYRARQEFVNFRERCKSKLNI
jgi:DTW domain-containing protein YfiP